MVDNVLFEIIVSNQLFNERLKSHDVICTMANILVIITVSVSITLTNWYFQWRQRLSKLFAFNCIID